MVPTVTAKVSFQNFNKNLDMSDDLFKIPSDYAENVEKFNENELNNDENNLD